MGVEGDIFVWNDLEWDKLPAVEFSPWRRLVSPFSVGCAAWDGNGLVGLVG